MSEGLISGAIEQEWRAIPVDDVIVRERQRKVRPEHVKAVRESFDALGGRLMLQPIVVDENLVLADGAHRLQAAKESGWTHIPALVFHGATDADRELIEFEANRVRLQLTPLELEEAWTTHLGPAYRARAKKNHADNGKAQAANLVQNQVEGSEDDRIHRGIENFNTPVNGPSLPKAAREATGLSLLTINKITDIRTLAQSQTSSEELREAAEKGLRKLSRPGASVDAVHNELLKWQERERLHSLSPSEAQQRLLEKKLDQALTDTTLQAEKFGGTIGADLEAAARLNQEGAESLRAVRVALAMSIAAILAIECKLDPDPNSALQRLGAEMTRMISEKVVGYLGMEVDRG